jgi:hypothetical protein
MAISSLGLTALQNLVVSVNNLNKAFQAYFIAKPSIMQTQTDLATRIGALEARVSNLEQEEATGG